MHSHRGISVHLTHASCTPIEAHISLNLQSHNDVHQDDTNDVDDEEESIDNPGDVSPISRDVGIALMIERPTD